MLGRLRQFATGRGPAIVAWLLLATGDVFADALQDAGATFRRSTSVGLWLAWAAVLIVLVLPGSTALVVARTAVTAAIPATIWALAAAGDPDDPVHFAQTAFAVLAGVAVLAPAVGERFIDAASYGDERRFLLRPPFPVVVGALVPAWLVAVAGVTAGPLLLFGEKWVAGSVLTVVGVPVAFLSFRALHSLARRWLVFVPAGLVVHDHVAIREPVLIPRASIRSLAPARADTSATDLTAQANGLALELDLDRPVTIPVPAGRGKADETAVERLLLTPTRPASVMTEARQRRIPTR